MSEFAKGIILSVITFLSPIYGLLLTVGLFILFDTIIGLYKSSKIKEPITSKKLRIGILSKIIPYQTSVILFYMMDFFILNEFTHKIIDIKFFLTKILSLTLIYIEFISINENWKVIKGKSLLTYFYDMLKLKDKITNKIKKTS